MCFSLLRCPLSIWWGIVILGLVIIFICFCFSFLFLFFVWKAGGMPLSRLGIFPAFGLSRGAVAEICWAKHGIWGGGGKIM